MSTINRLNGNNTATFSLPDEVIFYYTALMDALKRYSRPRDKVTQLIKTGVVTRIKKGMYVDGRKDLRALPVREAAANLLYGLSYVSLQFALSSHGLIPEAAIQVTSVTFKKTKHYRAPGGFHRLQESAQPAGI